MRSIRAANSRAICGTILGVEEPSIDLEDWEGARERSRARHEADRRRRAAQRRRGRLVAAGAAGLLLLVVVLVTVAAGGGDGGNRRSRAERAGDPATAAAKANAELPGGGRTIFPGKRVIA